MRVLVTNDDGVDAPGLWALAGAVQAAGHDVVVAAPLSEASGMSAALTAVVDDGRIALDRRRIGEAPGFGVAASPAYIVLLAGLGVFGEPPHVVLAGINRGANAGTAVFHSATVGAAVTAAGNGIRAMAVSLDVRADGGRHWSAAASLACGLLGDVAAAEPGAAWNLNVPDRPVGDIGGVRPATLARFGQVRMALAELGEGFVSTTFEPTGERLVPGTDRALLAEGYATLTALRPIGAAPGVLIPAQRSASFPEEATGIL